MKKYFVYNKSREGVDTFYIFDGVRRRVNLNDEQSVVVKYSSVPLDFVFRLKSDAERLANVLNQKFNTNVWYVRCFEDTCKWYKKVI